MTVEGSIMMKFSSLPPKQEYRFKQFPELQTQAFSDRHPNDILFQGTPNSFKITAGKNKYWICNFGKKKVHNLSLPNDNMHHFTVKYAGGFHYSLPLSAIVIYTHLNNLDSVCSILYSMVITCVDACFKTNSLIWTSFYLTHSDYDTAFMIAS